MYLCKSLLPGLIVGLSHASIALAAPIVTDQQISWPDDGWYQVQDASNYASLCEGGSSCDVDPGTYIVINHTTGERFESVTVTESGSTPLVEPTVNGNTISWPDDGWYQVQDASSYASLCQGGLSCSVPAGTYIVINLTTGVRFEGLTVGTITDPGDGGDPNLILPSSPANASIKVYAATLAELFWDRPAASERVSFTEVWRDGEFLGSAEGNSYYDDTRTQGVPHWYEFVAVDADGDRSAASTLNVLRAQQTLQPMYPTTAESYRSATAFEGDTALIGADVSNSVTILTRDTTTGDWQTAQLLRPGGYVYADDFGENIALSGDTMLVRGSDVDDDQYSGEQMLYVYTRDSSGVWNETQRIKGAVSNDHDGYAIDGDTLAINRYTGIDLFERNLSSGQWELEQHIPLADELPDNFNGKLALDNDRLLAGTSSFRQNDINTGAAFLYRKVAGNWELEQQLIPEAAEPNNVAGYSIAIDGSTIAVSMSSGNIAIYELGDNGAWTEASELAGVPYSGRFEPSMKIDDDLLLAGFNHAHGLVRDSGIVYVYEQNASGTWGVKTKLVAPEGVSDFGLSVSFDNGEVLVSGKNNMIDNSSYYGVTEGYLFDLK